jgi:hypothetical protein
VGRFIERATRKDVGKLWREIIGEGEGPEQWQEYGAREMPGERAVENDGLTTLPRNWWEHAALAWREPSNLVCFEETK